MGSGESKCGERTGAELWEVKSVQGKVSVENVLGQNYGK